MAAGIIALRNVDVVFGAVLDGLVKRDGRALLLRGDGLVTVHMMGRG